MNEDDAIRAALSQYYDSSRPAGYAASFRAGWDAGRVHEAGHCTHDKEAEEKCWRAVVVRLVSAWNRGWDCSRDPGHVEMNHAIGEAEIALSDAVFGKD